MFLVHVLKYFVKSSNFSQKVGLLQWKGFETKKENVPVKKVESSSWTNIMIQDGYCQTEIRIRPGIDTILIQDSAVLSVKSWPEVRGINQKLRQLLYLLKYEDK